MRRGGADLRLGWIDYAALAVALGMIAGVVLELLQAAAR